MIVCLIHITQYGELCHLPMANTWIKDAMIQVVPMYDAHIYIILTRSCKISKQGIVCKDHLVDGIVQFQEDEKPSLLS